MEAPGKRTDDEHAFAQGKGPASPPPEVILLCCCSLDCFVAALSLHVSLTSPEMQMLESFSRPGKRKYTEDTSMRQEQDPERHEVETLPLSHLSLFSPSFAPLFLPPSLPPFL
jgi:hypothetical protein